LIVLGIPDFERFFAKVLFHFGRHVRHSRQYNAGITVSAISSSRVQNPVQPAFSNLIDGSLAG